MFENPTNIGAGYPLTRRRFMQSAAGLIAISPLGSLVRGTGTFDQNFTSPPESARMWTWWFWLSDRVDTKSITADLEAMEAQGIGGVTVYSLSNPGDKGPHGPDYMTAAWCELFQHTVREAKRLGLGVSTMLCSGWDAGGPWITPEHACKRYTYSELALTGPRHFRGELPRPGHDPRFYRDIAVQAFRVSPNQSTPSITDKAVIESRNALLGYKNGTDSPDKTYQHSIREMCEAPIAPLPASPDGNILDPTDCVDLGSCLGNNDALVWDVPAGDWIVFRFGCTLTGKKTSFSSPTGEGLEGDPLDSAAMEAQFQHIGGVLRNVVGPDTGRVFRSVQIDSWEIELPNWTMKFLETFQANRGYDARPYLPALTGRTVGSAEVSDRFLHDYRNTLGDCVAENYFGSLTKMAEAVGLIQQSEAGGICYPKLMSMDALKNLGRCHVPMGEFWHSPAWTEKDDQNITGKQTACAAHLYGKREAAAEAFASVWHWVDSPATLKPTADRAFCEGLNRFFIYSTATHSRDGTPGAEFDGGTHFNRQITWWNKARPFCDYIARCSHLLQQGLFVADVLFYNGDGCPNYVAPKHIEPGLGAGYDYDVCNSEILLTRLSVRGGRIVLPDGMTYRLMVLPDRLSMPLEVVRKLKQLVADGMTLIGPKPVQTPGLAGYPRCDQHLRAEAEELWGNCDGQTVKERPFGKGRIAWGITPRDLLTRDGIPPDFEHDGSSSTFLDWIHRRDDSRDIYFIANRKDHPESRTCTFRVSGRQPKILDPITGAISDARAFVQSEDRTSLPLEFAPHGSAFVIFDMGIPKARKGTGQTNAGALMPLTRITGPWNVRFDPRWGGPASVEFPELVDWTHRPEDGIKYYSGLATYSKRWQFNPQNGRRVFIDLGDVKELAEVRLNGTSVGIAWTRPYRLEISSAVKRGENELEIDVVNLWPNRMIGDGPLPPDKRFTSTNISIYYERKPQTLLPSGLLGPVTVLVDS